MLTKMMLKFNPQWVNFFKFHPMVVAIPAEAKIREIQGLSAEPTLTEPSNWPMAWP